MSIAIVYVFAFVLLAMFYVESKPRMTVAFATVNNGSGRRTKFDLVMRADAVSTPASMPVQKLVKQVAVSPKAKGVVRMATLVVHEDQGMLSHKWVWGIDNVWAESVADHECGSFIKLDLSDAKRLKPVWIDGHNVTQDYIVGLIDRLINSGIKDGETVYYVSGSTQSTKSGILYAYSQQGFWQANGFSKIKDLVRGGALHAPAYRGIFDCQVDLLPVANDSTYRIGDGQMAAGRYLYRVLSGGTDVFPPAMQIRATLKGMGKDNILCKGVIVYDNTLQDWQLAVRAEDIKGDGAKHLKPAIKAVVSETPNIIAMGIKYIARIVPFWATGMLFDSNNMAKKDVTEHVAVHDGTVTLDHGYAAVDTTPTNELDMVIGVLEVARPLTMQIGHQTLSFATPSVFQAMKDQREQTARDLNDMATSLDKLACMSGVIRTDNGFDQMALLGRAAEFCQRTGNTQLMESAGINRMLRETFAEWYRRAALGNMKTRLLTAVTSPNVPKTEVWANPRDFSRREWHYEEECPAYWPNNTKVRAIRMPDTLGGISVILHLDNTVPSGKVWCHPTALTLLGLDFDGDRLALLLDSGPVEHAMVEMANPANMDVDKSGARAAGEVPDNMAYAIFLQLSMNVGRPFALIQKMIAVVEKTEKTNPGMLNIVKAYVDEQMPEVAHQGQLGVDNAKRFGVHNNKFLKEVNGVITDDFGLEKSDMAWYHLARSDVRAWLPVRDSAEKMPKLDEFGDMVLLPNGKVAMDDGERWLADQIDGHILPEDYTLNTLVNPADVCDDFTPISESFKWYGDHLIMPVQRVKPNGVFTNRLPDATYADKAFLSKVNAFWKYVVDRQADVAKMVDEDERKDASMGLTQYMAKTAEKMRDNPEQQRAFLMRLWHMEFSGNSKQSILWKFMPDELFDLLDEFADLWDVANDGTISQTYGVKIAEGAYDVTAKYDDDGKQMWTLTKDSQVITAPGMTTNPYFETETAMKATVTPINGTTMSRIVVLTEYANTMSEERLTVLLRRANFKAIQLKTENAWIFGDRFKTVDGKDWLEMTGSKEWKPVAEAYIRAIAMSVLDNKRIATWADRAAERKMENNLDNMVITDDMMPEGMIIEDYIPETVVE